MLGLRDSCTLSVIFPIFSKQVRLRDRAQELLHFPLFSGDIATWLPRGHERGKHSAVWNGLSLANVLLIFPLVLVLSSSGCDGDGGGGAAVDGGGSGRDAAASGRSCSVGVDAGSTTVIASPALECESRTCVHVADRGPDLCAAPCSVSSDCVAAADTPCVDGFACDFVTAVGPFACRRFCLCQAYLPDGGLASTCN